MKAVVFDFDGTLTEKKGNLWKRIWKELGHSVDENSYYMSLLNKFMSGNLTHRDWCVLTLKAFQEKGFAKQKLYEIINDMTLIQGAEDLIKHLYSQGIELHIVSGNIISVIEKVLGDNKQYISSIKANEFVFDENGYITEIIGTKYDHEGKATFILELCKSKGYKPSEVLFIGNSINDEWVYKSGARTLCVNPDETKIDNKTIWNKVIYTDNLLDLEKEI
ncbi:MAG: HAD-IB family phosphatase [Bacilli bacterium]|nr:HAD-IB family phosphatase [Bacilli bacterium]